MVVKRFEGNKIFFSQSPRNVLLLVHQPMQNHEVHCVAKVQVPLHRTHPPHHRDPLYCHPAVLATGKDKREG